MKKKINLLSNSFNDIVNTLADLALKADPCLDQMRVVYMLKDENMTYMLTAFEFIDLDLAENKIKSIALYQLID